jgi:hypothetical protein
MDLDHVLDVDEGRLISGRDAMAKAFENARKSNKPIVVHFHGGLVSRDSALARAPALQTFYESAGAYPVIPVWKTGAWEVAQDIWMKIAAEALFKILVDRVAGFAHARLKDVVGARSMSVERSLGKVTDEVVAESATGDGDFPQEFLGIDLNAVRGNPELELTDFQRMSMEGHLQGDAELNLVVDAVLQGAGLGIEEGARGPGGFRAPQPIASVADREALKTLQGEANTRSLGIGAALAVVKIVAKVIGRFISNSDHGFHATVVEEVLRAFYLDGVGQEAWSKMKEYAAEAFLTSTTNAAGLALIEEIKKIPQTQRLMLVGHSAGAIFISQILKNYDGGAKRFEIAFLAPASTIALFVEAVIDKQPLLAVNKAGKPKFRMFSMNDKFESKDTLVRNVPVLGDLTWFYPRSLLYLISGILERDAHGDVVDAAISGLQRIYLPAYRSAGSAEIEQAREFTENHAERRVWSVQNHPDDRFRSNSTSHGGFGAPVPGNTTMESVAALLVRDW